MSLLATAKLEGISIKKGLTTFGLKMKLYIKAQKEVFNRALRKSRGLSIELASVYTIHSMVLQSQVTDTGINCVISVNKVKDGVKYAYVFNMFIYK